MRRLSRALLVAVLISSGLSYARPSPALAYAPVFTIEVSDDLVPYDTVITVTGHVQDGDTDAPLSGIPVALCNRDDCFLHGATDLAGDLSTPFTVPFSISELYVRGDGIEGRSETVFVTGHGPSMPTIDVQPNPVVEHHRFVTSVSVKNVYRDTPFNYGDATLRDTTSGMVLGSVHLDDKPGEIWNLAGLDVGTHILVADFKSADKVIEDSTSEPFELIVVPDTVVEWDTPMIDKATFYPVKDGYLDTVVTKGRLAEPGVVALDVISLPTGRIVRHVAYTNDRSFDFSYGFEWDGTNAVGTIQPAGTYRLRQTFTDRHGNTTVWSADVSLSTKKLYWYTASRRKISGDAFFAKGTWEGAWVRRAASSYDDGVKLYGGTANYGRAAVAWKTRLPSFTVPAGAIYRRVTFGVLGRSPAGKAHPQIGIYNTTFEDETFIGSYDARQFIPTAYGWHETSAASTNHIRNRYVNGMLLVPAEGGGAYYDVAKVRFRYRYALLK